jgi:hypothetical protein
MKTAISIPDPVFEAADQLAARIGMSRSELYATAVAEFMDRHRAAGVRERLDAAYELYDESARLESVMAIVQSESIPREDW